MNQEEFNQVVNQFKETKDKNKNPLAIHYFMIKDEEDHEFLHAFNDAEGPRDIRSISKTVMTLFFGILMEKSKEGAYPEVSEETYIYPILKDVVDIRDIENHKKFQKVQIKHLLTHTVGYDKVLMMRGDIKAMDPYDYLDYVVNSPIVHEPGEKYIYSNAGFYMLSAVLQELLGEDLLDVFGREFFKPLGIENYKWEKYGNYLAGATRLWLLPEDLMAIGKLMLNKGMYNGVRLYSENWQDEMLIVRERTEKVDTPDATFRRYGYGYGLWRAKHSIFFGHGTDGQMLVIVPEEETILLTLSTQSDMKPLEAIINETIEKII